MNGKVLFVTTEFGKRINGGAGRVVNGIVEELKKEPGIDVFHMFFNYPLLRWLSDSYCMEPGHDFIRSRKYNGKYIDNLITLIRQRNYQIVHFAHNCRPVAQCMEAVRKEFPRIRIVYTCHSISFYEKNIRRPYPDNFTTEKVLLHNSDRLHLLNNASLEFFRQSYPEYAETKAFSIIPNGIDSADYRDTDKQWACQIRQRCGNRKIIVCISRFCHGKGIEYLLDSVPEVVSKRKDVMWIIAGRKQLSWENQAGRYVKFIDRKAGKLKDHIIILGWLDDIKRNTLLSTADIAVMPSQLEYYPYSVLEPAVMKVPLISSVIAPVRELFVADKECSFYSPENPAELALRTLELLDDPGKAARQAARAFDRISTTLTWENIAHQYRNMYENMLETPQQKKDKS